MTREMYRRAKNYTKMGWIVHPLHSPKDEKISIKERGKKPLLKGYNEFKEPMSDKELKKWFLKTDYNIGLVTGKRSNVIAIDFDNYRFRDALFDGVEVDTLQDQRINGHGHYYFEWDKNVESRKIKEFGIEIITNGANVVLPPSIHRKGQTYEMVHFNKETIIQPFPKKITENLENLIDTKDKLVSTINNKCRSWVYQVWKNKPDVHDEHTMLALTDELVCNGANEPQIQMFCNIMLRKHYKKSITHKKYGYVKKYIDNGGKPYTYKQLKENLPSEIAQYVQKETSGRDYNPQAILPEIINRTLYLKDNCYIFIDGDNDVIFRNKKTHKEFARLRYNKDDECLYDDNHAKTGKTVKVNENNSALYVFFLDSLKEKGVPIGHKWNLSKSKTCRTRVFKRLVTDFSGAGWATEYFAVCKTKDENGKWNICRTYVPMFTPLHAAIKKTKIRELYQQGIPTQTLAQLFGYRSPRIIQRYIKDLKQSCSIRKKK